METLKPFPYYGYLLHASWKIATFRSYYIHCDTLLPEEFVIIYRTRFEDMYKIGMLPESSMGVKQ